MNEFSELREKLSLLWNDNSLDDGLLVDIYSVLDKIETQNNENERQVHRLESSLNHFPNPIFEEDFTGARIIIDSLKEQGVVDIEGYLLSHPEMIEEITRSITITAVNYATLKLYGVDSFEEFYTNTFEIIAKESYGDFIKQVMAITEGEDHFEQEMENKNNLKELEYLIVTLSVIDREQFGLSRVLLTMVDITELKRMQNHKMLLEEKLLMAKQFETLGKLAGGVAHDLNNVLVGLVSYPDMLMYGMSDSDSMKEPLKTIKGAGDAATTIVQDLLTLSRRSATVYETVEMNGLISSVLEGEALQDKLQNKSLITIKRNLAKDLPKISGSQSHLKKMISNLIINAIESLDFDGGVLVETCSQVFNTPPPTVPELLVGPYIKITVADTGKGMTEQEITQIFEPFFSKKSLGYNVSGIGMTVVRGVVEEHQGYIAVESVKGEGSSFVIYLPAPIDHSLKGAIESNVEEDIKGNGQKILVVDDMDLQRSVTVMTLERLGYTVEGSSSGEAALKKLTQGIPPDLVLLDMIMPGMDGLETCRNILKLYPKQRIVMLSGFAESERVNEALERGALGFIHKPYSVKKLGTEMSSYLKGSAYEK